MGFEPGDIYWALVGPTRHPVIIVSRESLNRGDYIVAVPCTTARLDERQGDSNYLHLEAGEGGLPKECLAAAHQVSAIETVDVAVEDGKIGHLDAGRMRDLIRAIGNVIEADCEPD